MFGLTKIVMLLFFLLISPPMVQEVAQAAFSDKNSQDKRVNASEEIDPDNKHLFFHYDLEGVLKKDTSGLSLMNYPKDVLKKYEDQAEDFIAFRRGRLSNPKKADLIAQCLARPGSHLYCEYLQKGWAKALEEKEAELEQASDSKSMRRQEIVEAIEAGDAVRINEVSRRKVYRALSRFDGWERLEKLTSKILEGKCFSSKLGTALGMKAEEYFPEEKYQEIATSLYKKVHSCGSKFDDEANLARFRMALIHVWKDQCNEADPILEQLSEDEEGLYITRALYWRAHCAEATGNKLLLATLRNRLMKVNPLGYHTLLMNRDRAFQMVNSIYTKKAKVQLRTRIVPDINSRLLAVELLLENKRGRGYAREILNYVENKILPTELEFRLYIAVLFKRTQEAIAPLRIISEIFRDDPGLITQDTMKIFYPLKKFQTLWSHRRNIDPYLLAALIRQESGFDESARSHAGALGLMQLLPSTARRMGRVSSRQLLRARTNVRLGSKYLRRLIQKFDGDAELALAAYNAGPRKVVDWKKRYPIENRMLFLDLIPFSETRNYVVLISRNYFWYLNLYANRAVLPERLPGRQIASRSDRVVFKTFQMK